MNDYPPGEMPSDAPQPGSLPSDDSQQSDQTGPPQQPRKNRRRLWIALMAALILLLSVGGLAYFLVLPAIQQASPDGTLQTYCDASKKMDAHELVSTFSTSLKARPQNGEADFGFTFGILKFEGILATGCTVSNVQQHGSTATATVTISYQLPQNKTDSTVQTVSLIVENGVWKVNNYTVRNR